MSKKWSEMTNTDKRTEHGLSSKGGSCVDATVVMFCRCGFEAWGTSDAAAAKKLDRHILAPGAKAE